MTEQRNVETSVAAKRESARTVIGVVISDKMNKTIVVQVERKVKHPLFGKYIRRFSKMYAHDEDNMSRVGDLVLIQQTRPLSKTKRWKLVEVLRKQEQQ